MLTRGENINAYVCVICVLINDCCLFAGTRETAFIYSILSAGVVHAVTQSCSAGNLTECTCDMTRYGEHDVEGWKWGGCSDNVKYGVWFSKTFVDAPETLQHQSSRNIRNLMNLHNNEVGRRVSMF
jgi:wingless-type MMTV integration site family protein 16